MSQNAERERIKRVMRALQAKIDDQASSPNEVAEAMRKFGQFMQDYDLTMDEVFIREQPCSTMTIPTGLRKRGPMDQVAVALGALHGCRVWIEGIAKGTGSMAELKFFGMEQDLENLEYMFHLIKKSMEHDAEVYMHKMFGDDRSVRGAKRNHRSQFMKGFVAKMCSRIREMKEERDAALRAAMTTGTALIVLKGTLVEQAYQEQYSNMRLRRPYQSYKPKVRPGANNAGMEAAQKVNLDMRVIQSQGANKLMLT